MKIYKIYSLLGLCYVYSMNPVEHELMEEVRIRLSDGFKETVRDCGKRGIEGPSGFIATMFSGPDPMIYEHTKDGGRFFTFELA
ncbi:MAG: hypothetical protein FWG91_08880 [Lachnospiraceae bacterium]|nr:hypothetical protein [Lachnospiraceae bacterium]